MNVPVQIQKRITKVLEDGIVKINTKYGVKMKMPRVIYTKRGRVAGTANYRDWVVNFNPVLLMENLEDFITRTVPHELGHLGTHAVYPDSLERVGGWGRRRGKRDIHGYRWQEVMRVLGVKDATRCHTYDVTNAKVRNKASYIYVCSAPGCGADVRCGPKIHAQLQRTPMSRWHRGCKGHQLVLVGAPAVLPARKTAPYVPPIVLRTKPIHAGSKLDHAKALYKANKDKLFRQDMVDLFMKQLDMSRAGASTYFYNCQKAFG